MFVITEKVAVILAQNNVSSQITKGIQMATANILSTLFYEEGSFCYFFIWQTKNWATLGHYPEFLLKFYLGLYIQKSGTLFWIFELIAFRGSEKFTNTSYVL